MANKTKVIHVGCGGQVAWYLGSHTKSTAPMLSKDWLREVDWTIK